MPVSMLLYVYGFLIAYTPWVFAFQPDVVEYDGHLSIRLQHSFDQVKEPQFFDRGAVNIQSIRTGAVTLQQGPLSAEDRQKLKAIAEKDGLYRLRAFVQAMDGKETSFLTFVKACSLAESHLSDVLTVSLDHTGSVIAVSMSTSPAICEGRHISHDDLKHFNTTVFVKHMEQGPIPDTAAYIQKLEKEREARERGETKDNRSFFARYVSYLENFLWKLLHVALHVIVVLVFFFIQMAIFQN